MKKIFSFLAVFISSALSFAAIACDICQLRQPKILKGISHGTGPQANTDYIIICLAVIIVTITLLLSIKYLVKPKETAPDHIKNIILE